MFIVRKELISMKQVIHTDSAPAAIGPYSQAIQIGDLLFVSGQVPIDPEHRRRRGGGHPGPGPASP